MNITPLTIELGNRQSRFQLPATDEVHLIVADLDAVDHRELASSLSEDERCRAARFRCVVDCVRFTAARGLLRKCLGQFIGVRPGEICFSYGPHGKPALAFPHSEIRFNVSHSSHLAIFAFTNGCEVGVDVELIRPDIDLESLAQRFLPHPQASGVQQAPPHQQAAVFLHHWTRTEAISKMLGTGLAGGEQPEDINQVRNDISPDSVPQNVHVLSFGTQAVIALATSKPIQIIRALDGGLRID